MSERPRETATYTHGHHESVLRSHTWRTASNSAAYLLDRLTPAMQILDVGCGPGTISADLAALVPEGRVVAVDHAPMIVDQARRTATERGLTNVEVAVADVNALEYADDTFDVVHAHQVLQHVGDPVQALREMRRVCRPGGVVAARDSDYAAMTWYPLTPGLDGWLDLYRRVARSAGGEPDAGRRLRSWALAAGFGEVTTSASAWCYAEPEERAWWSGLWADRTIQSSYAERAVAGGHATAAELQAIAEAWRTWGAAADGWFAVLHGEILGLP
jgi:2-polyprenyl-3-methyl-5-hydroxy-6-metoxy-1,4-benzoquinol methylase